MPRAPRVAALADEVVVVAEHRPAAVRPGVGRDPCADQLGQHRPLQQGPADHGQVGGAGPVAGGVQPRGVAPGRVGAAQLGALGPHGLEEAGPAAARPGRGQGLGGVVGRLQQQGGEQLLAADPPAGLVAEAGAVDPLGGLGDPQDLPGPVGIVGHDGGENLGGRGDQHRPVGLALPEHGAGGRVHDHAGPRLDPRCGRGGGGRDRHPSHDQGKRQEQGGQPPLAGAHAGRLPEPVEETQHPRAAREGGNPGGDGRRRRRVIAGSSASALRPA
jgi:hypothetical protein